MYRVLVVANETAGARELQDEVARISAEHGGDVAFHVCCPAHPRRHGVREAWTQEGAIEDAQRRLDRTLETLRAAGHQAGGEVGDLDPVAAMADALRLWPADMLLVSTHPEPHSGWLRKGILDKARRFGLPVRHVMATEVPEGAATAS